MIRGEFVCGRRNGLRRSESALHPTIKSTQRGLAPFQGNSGHAQGIGGPVGSEKPMTSVFESVRGQREHRNGIGRVNSLGGLMTNNLPWGRWVPGRTGGRPAM